MARKTRPTRDPRTGRFTSKRNTSRTRRPRRNPGIPLNTPLDMSREFGPEGDLADDLLAGTKKFPAAFQRGGGVAELSSWGADVALWTRSYLRDYKAVVSPASVEGLWYAVAVIRGMATEEMGYVGVDNEKIKRLARQLAAELNKARDIYDS